MAIKGYLAEEGMRRVRGFISDSNGVSHAVLNLEHGNASQQINLVWSGLADQSFVQTTNSIANNNEILFRIGDGVAMGDLTLNIGQTGNPVFGTFILDKAGEIGNVVYSDNVILYNKIRLTFAYRTYAI